MPPSHTRRGSAPVDRAGTRRQFRGAARASRACRVSSLALALCVLGSGLIAAAASEDPAPPTEGAGGVAPPATNEEDGGALRGGDEIQATLQPPGYRNRFYPLHGYAGSRILEHDVKKFPSYFLEWSQVAVLEDEYYVVSPKEHVLRRVPFKTPYADFPGYYELVAGSQNKPGFLDGTGTRAQFDRPMAVDWVYAARRALWSWEARGVRSPPRIVRPVHLLVAEANNHIVRLIDLSTQKVSVLAGTPRTAGHVDGEAARARFLSPLSIAVWQSVRRSGRDEYPDAVHVSEQPYVGLNRFRFFDNEGVNRSATLLESEGLVGWYRAPPRSIRVDLTIPPIKQDFPVEIVPPSDGVMDLEVEELAHQTIFAFVVDNRDQVRVVDYVARTVRSLVPGACRTLGVYMTWQTVSVRTVACHNWQRPKGEVKEFGFDAYCGGHVSSCGPRNHPALNDEDAPFLLARDGGNLLPGMVDPKARSTAGA